MKNIFFLIIFTLNFINFSYAGENTSCENIDKLSKEYVKCTVEKVKKITKEKTKKFKKSKTLQDLFKND